MALRILWNNRLVLTTAQAAERYGVTPAGMRANLRAIGFEPIPESLDGRTPLYLATELDRAMKSRPGRGAHLRRGAAR